MANVSYDKSIGTENRSAVAGTKLWAIVLGFVLLFGIGMLVIFFTGTNSQKGIGGAATDNTTTRPAEP